MLAGAHQYNRSSYHARGSRKLPKRALVILPKKKKKVATWYSRTSFLFGEQWKVF